VKTDNILCVGYFSVTKTTLPVFAICCRKKDEKLGAVCMTKEKQLMLTYQKESDKMNKRFIKIEYKLVTSS
jgi:hypothetical protein